ncbi:MAG TPA: aldose 1-epimerase family protein, partial [Acidimicrobiales bacterium]
MGALPSGEQFGISWGDQSATIVEVGGGIRRYAVGDRDVLQPYPAEAMADGAHGAPLIPWPNRLEDGRYAFDGVDLQVALSEPDKANAIHGLLRWRSWRAGEHRADRVVLSTRLHPSAGYPFTLDISMAYALGPEGLEVTATATNVGDGPAPYGFGQHPYLSPGRGLIDDCSLQFEASTRIVTDDARQIPTGVEPVAGSAYDFATPRPIGDLVIDAGFTDLARDADGRAWVRLGGPDGRTAELWVDDRHPVLQLYSAHGLAPDRQRRGLAAEPMTCPPNALRTGDRLLRLEPGAAVSTRWG